MMGLVYKDLMVLKKQILMYLSFYVFYGLLVSAGAFDLSILGGLTAMFGTLVTVSSMAYDEQAKWTKFAAATPVGRKGVVGGKYLLPLVVIPASALVTAAVEAALCLTGRTQEDLLEALLVTLICSAVAVLLNALILPLLFKFGTEKARVLFLLLFAVFFGGAMLLATMMKNGADFTAALHFGARLGPLTPILLAIAVAAAYALSYFISLGIMEKKEL